MATIPEALAIAIEHHQGGRLENAERIYRQILQADPNQPEAIHFLGVMAHQVGQPQLAAAYIERSIRLKPTVAAFHNNLAQVYRSLRRISESIACARQAVALRTDFADPHHNLGLALKDQGKLDEAIACFRRAVELHPGFTEAYNSLGLAFQEQGNLDDAIACFGRAAELRPSFGIALNSLGNAFVSQGKLERAVACFRRAVELNPRLPGMHSNLVYAQLFNPDCDGPTLREEHRRWSQTHAAPFEGVVSPHGNDPAPDRRLRLGYVSPNLRDHVVGRNILPLFREHNHQQFEIFAYADTPYPDALTDRLRRHAEAWCDTSGLTDEELAQRIREDRIDLLVDLTLHMDQNRLLVFARKPAPIQLCFAGYPGTTGLPQIDYRLTDPHLDPPGLNDQCYSEQSIRLPDSFWCYDPIESEPAVNALPAAENGWVTFGCLNNFAKVNPRGLKLWASVLRRVDRSRLIMRAGAGSHRQEALNLLTEEGIGPERITFVTTKGRQEYLAYYHAIDIGLDTIPYNGHTTSLDSFWMGVPVVTLVGSTVVGRAGVSQLMNLGLPELIASTPQQFVQIAAELATDPPRLRRLRSTLRDRMQASPLMDAPRFARGIETAYRNMWHRWCAKQPFCPL